MKTEHKPYDWSLWDGGMGYSWCFHCNVATAHCPRCGINACAGGGCEHHGEGCDVWWDAAGARDGEPAEPTAQQFYEWLEVLSALPDNDVVFPVHHLEVAAQWSTVCGFTVPGEIVARGIVAQALSPRERGLIK